MSFLAFILISQVVAVVCVAFILKIVLNNMLIDLAARHIEVWKCSEAKGIGRILIVIHRPLKKVYADRIKKAVERNFPVNTSLDFQIQRSIWGGAIVRVGDQMIDCSLKDRVLQALRMK
jgi:F0F1-type ATP synthase delta subunit